MTIEDAVRLVDHMKPNQYSDATKIRWLNKLDGMIWKEVFLTHEDKPEGEFEEYEDDMTQTLLVPEPYAMDVYNFYLQSQIDKENMETAKYNQSAALYNSAYQSFTNYYNRTHRPIPRRSQFLF